MRKVSKNRTDEDVISSTNGSGSVVNEGSNNADHSTEETEKESDSNIVDAEDSGNGLSDKEKDDSPKKRGRNSKPKRKSAGKAKKDEEKEEYEVEKIVGSKKIKGKVHYLIHWKGYTTDEDTWEPEDTLSCPDIINKFNEEKENSKEAKLEEKKGNKRKSLIKSKSQLKKAKNDESDTETEDDTLEHENENSKEAKPEEKKGNKRKRLIKSKSPPKKAKNDESDTETEDDTLEHEMKKGKTRKSLSKGKSSPKKALNEEWDSENADETAEYEVERILEVHHKKSGKREFLIHWKGWSSKFDSWEPESNLNCSELIKKFMEKVDVARKTDSRRLRVAPETTNRFTLQDPCSGRRLSKRKNQRQRVRYDNAE